MIKLSDLTKDYKVGKGNSRKELVKMFVETLNRDRIKSKLKPLEARYYAIQMAKIPTYDLEKYFRECEASGNFGKMWWGNLKKK